MILLPYHHHCIAPGTLVGLDSTQLQHLPQVVPNLFNQWQGNLNCSLKGMSSITFIMCSVEGVQPNSTGSNENTSWYLARSQQAASASSGDQESNPLKSNSSNSLPCLCLTVNLAVWGPWGSSPPPVSGPPWVVWAPVALQLPWPLGFSSKGSVSKPCCSLPP